MTDNKIEFYDIPNLNGYKINKKGVIYSDKSKKILKTRICNGYETINIIRYFIVYFFILFNG